MDVFLSWEGCFFVGVDIFGFSVELGTCVLASTRDYL